MGFNILTSIFVLLPSSMNCDKNNKGPCLPYLENMDLLLRKLPGK